MTTQYKTLSLPVSSTYYNGRLDYGHQDLESDQLRRFFSGEDENIFGIAIVRLPVSRQMGKLRIAVIVIDFSRNLEWNQYNLLPPSSVLPNRLPNHRTSVFPHSSCHNRRFVCWKCLWLDTKEVCVAMMMPAHNTARFQLTPHLIVYLVNGFGGCHWYPLLW